MAQTPKPQSEQPLTWQHDDDAQQSPGTATQTNVTQTDVSQHTSHHHQNSHNDAAAAIQQQASSGQDAEPLQKWQLHSSTPSEASSVLSDSLTGPLLDQTAAAVPKGSAQSVHPS
eukprot:9981-Heterococcus_DN1.PRE.4